MLRITIAGASGYIGQNLIENLPKEYTIRGLSRSPKTSPQENLTWKSVDLFSSSHTSQALKDTDVAIYLVHSMLPSTRLFQGSFHDTDLILADNFAHACIENQVKQIVYLSGIVPLGKTSKHLQSRKEVEDVFLATGIPCTILRAGLVVGNGGSSYEILKNLAINLPAMILPKWTQSKTQIIYIDDIVEILKDTVRRPEAFRRTLNVTNGENLKYKDLIRLTIKHVGKRIFTFSLPVNYTAISKLWVTLFGESKYELVSPLVDSLLCDFSEIRPDPLIQPHIRYRSYAKMLQEVSSKKIEKKGSTSSKPKKVNNVRSIQRLTTDTQLDAHDVADAYLKWLPASTNFFVRVQQKNDKIAFSLFGLLPLLILEYMPDLKLENRTKFHVKGGLLTKTKDTGSLEFRVIDRGRFVLASINEFIPSLPWFIYKYTQAPLHQLVMKRFGKYLSRTFPKRISKI